MIGASMAAATAAYGEPITVTFEANEETKQAYEACLEEVNADGKLAYLYQQEDCLDHALGMKQARVRNAWSAAYHKCMDGWLADIDKHRTNVGPAVWREQEDKCLNNAFDTRSPAYKTASKFERLPRRHHASRRRPWLLSKLVRSIVR
ncbi:MAG: hypothetical protein J2P49_08085 [Methylocapsa sp.]|nr:hypothetical protein [Methylocapsa sp.]